MALGEGVSARIAYKEYATGVISANTQPVSATDPAATGGQILRRTSMSLNLGKDVYQSEEIVGHRQIVDFRHGTKRVQGSLNGELSPATYWPLIEAACRGTEAAAIAKTEADFTSVAADNATSKFTFAAGDPVAEGYRVGMPLRFTNLSESTNNTKNFVVTAFGGTSNREVTVTPAPTTMGADTAFNVTSVGKRVVPPSSSHVSRKFAIESYHQDLDFHRLFTECRVGGVNLALPASGMSTIEIPFMGRDMETGSAGSSPFFTSPGAATTTGLLAAVNGVVLAGGTSVGVITGGQININLNPTSEPVVGQNFVPEIFLGRFNCTGQLTAFLQDVTFIDYFKDETEVALLWYLTASSAAAAQAMTIHLPRNKFGDAQVGLEGEAGIPITLPFQSLYYNGASPGIDATTAAFCDTEA